MDLKFKRRIVIHLHRYNEVNITLSYASTYASTYASKRDFYRRVDVVVGYCIIPGFDAGKKKSVHREAVVVPLDDLWACDELEFET